MRDPLARKLFQSRDAREKLRGMGGIMASSPELAQTVAKFQEGGDVTVPVVPTYSEWMQMSRSERRRAGLPESFIGGQMYFNRFGVGMGTNDPETGLPLRVPEDLAESGFGEFGGLPPSMTEPGGTVEEPLPGQGIFPGDIAFDIGEAVGMGPALEAAGVRDPAAVRAAERGAVRTEAQAEQEDRARRPAAQIIEEEVVEDAAPEPMTEEVAEEPAGPDAGTAAQIGLEGTGAAIGRGDFDTTYEQMLGRLQSVMGTEDKDSREKAMANLAMIGLAIAAGQSPNALTNIAQGALVGMKGIQEAEAAETAREREMRLEAMRLAASEVELGRRLQSAEDIAALRAGSGTGTYTQERLYQQNMSAIVSNPDAFDVFTEDNVVDPNKVTDLARRLSERGMSLGGAGDQQYTPGQLVVQDGVTYEYQQDGTFQRVGQ